MDLDVLARQVRDLKEWRDANEPMLADMRDEWGRFRAEKAEREQAKDPEPQAQQPEPEVQQLEPVAGA